MLKAAYVRPLKDLLDDNPHLKELKKKYQTPLGEQEARRKVEKECVIANVVALAVVISVHFSKGAVSSPWP
jgi:hypothetical protein